MNNFTLTFNKDNNFDPVSQKYGTEDDRMNLANTVRWFINCAEAAIEESYKDGAPRRIQMESLCANLRRQLVSQLTPDEIEELKLNR